MTLLITLIAAAASTVIWYTNKKRSEYRLGTLALIYWGASLMWLVDFISEYSELGSAYFNQSLYKVLNDSILGIAAVTLGLIIWLAVLLISDPRGVFKEKFTKKKINKKRLPFVRGAGTK